MAVGGVAPTPEGTAVVLTDETRRGLLLYVGGEDAAAIWLGSTRSEHRRFERAISGEHPFAHDLLDNVLKKLGGDVVSVKIDRIEDDVFYGSLLISKDGRLFELEARPSESIALAIGNSVPVFVAESVITQAGIDVDKLDFRRLRESTDAHEKTERTIARPGEVEL
jgi:bifunctional DNase/RNase